MAKRLSIMLVALLALGFVVAGCGDDEEDKAKEEAPAAPAPAEDEGGGDGGGAAADSPQVQQAIEDCKTQVNANPQVSDEAKEKIGEVCEEAASGDADAAITATEEACRIIVEDTAPAGPARETALKACEQTSP